MQDSYVRDSNVAFTEAIEFGWFTFKDAQEYMYMFSKGKLDYFKHIWDRKTITVAQGIRIDRVR